METKIGDCSQLMSKKIAPFFAAVQKIAKDDEIINMAWTVLGREIRHRPDQNDMRCKKQNIK
jgi:hypothetical protein